MQAIKLIGPLLLWQIFLIVLFFSRDNCTKIINFAKLIYILSMDGQDIGQVVEPKKKKNK